MPKIILTLFAFCLFTFSANAQYSLSGTLTNPQDDPVPYASIALSSTIDTSVIQFAVAKEDGSYTMKGIDSGKYILVIACVGYDVEHKLISISDNVENNNIVLTSGAVSMKEIMISAKRIPILMNGDTVIYNSSSFKTQSNASVEDLIKKMPGIQVAKDGSVSSEGKAITKILINGNEFFGGNIEAATKNLDASLVDKVEVIDKKTDEDEFTGAEDNEREKVINLVLKKDHAQGFFGRIRAGYGTDDYYNGHGNINFFRDATQLSLIGGLNNTNRDLYGWREMSTLNSFEINPFNNNNQSWNWGGGVKSREGVGANLHFEPVKGMKTDLSYVLSNEHNINKSTSNSEVYLTDNTIFSEGYSENSGNRSSHQINTKIEYEPDTLNRIVFRGQFSKQVGDNTARSLTQNFITADSIINSGVTKGTVDDDNQKFISKIHWTRKSKKRKDDRFISSVYFGDVTNGNNQGNYFFTAPSLLPFPSNESNVLNKNLRTLEQTIATTAAYQIQLSEKWMIKPGFNWMKSEYSHSFDWVQLGDDKLLSNSPTGSVKAQNMEYYVHISYKLDSVTTIYIVPEFNQTIENRSFVTDKNHQYGFNQLFFIPYMFIRSNKPHKYNFHFNIRANINKPQISQILPVTDDSNPYATTIGNIELQNAMNYRNGWSYQRMFGMGKTLSFNGWSSLSLNPVINKNTISSENYSISEVLNLKSRVYSNHSASLIWPIKPLKASFGLDVDYNYGHSYFIQNNLELESKNNTIGVGPTLQFNEFDMWSFDMDYMIKRQSGSIAGVENNAFLYHEVDAEFTLTPFDRLEWSSSLYLEIYGSNNAVGARTIPILTSELSFFIDKDKKWSLGAKAFDILDKNQNLWRWWTSNRFMQNQNNAVQRYLMGTVTYKIKKPTPKEPKDGPRGSVDKR
ncbi:carboxypeptidase-like regulatory domain-containing protein [Bacteroidia bacterium]|nr:carboxypeptidase-like regulatory domain-containing protein [Bacteroidia bacterium]MDB4107004.1 carboxypeptidase-like regulatory domain-containing protein [Bacteroidia bacterium]MDB9882464.1 carboxypeptidase-like regulatory domain-containing protein [Bacteroidia bacterium]